MQMIRNASRSVFNASAETLLRLQAQESHRAIPVVSKEDYSKTAKKPRGEFRPSLPWIDFGLAGRIILVALISSVVLTYSVTNPHGTVNLYLKQSDFFDSTQYDGGLWFAPNFFDRLNDQSLFVLSRAFEAAQHVRNSSTNVKGTAQICPVILSAVPRLDPHWVWLTSSLIREGQRKESVKSDLETGPVLVISRPGGALDQLRFPFKQRIVNKMLDLGLINVLIANHTQKMPPKVAFNHPLDDATKKQTEHFILQLFDHAAAWDSCLERGCAYCLVLEDDIVASTNWKRRITEAIQQVSATDPNWGVMKLFEIDPTLSFSPGWRGDTDDMTALFFFSLLPAVPLWSILAYRPGLSQIQGFRSFFTLYIWVLALTYLMGRSFFVPDGLLWQRPQYHQPTSTHQALHPRRGAVANLYRLSDLQALSTRSREQVLKSLEYASTYAGKDLSTLSTEESMRVLSMKHSDRIRADVFVAEYFLENSRSVRIIEPNVVQHIGFRSTEPNAESIRIAMSSTFEDGGLF